MKPMCLLVAFTLAGCWLNDRFHSASDMSIDDDMSGASSDGGDDLGNVIDPAQPRLLSPLSTATVTLQRPALRWNLGSGGGSPNVDLCKDRECAQPLSVTTLVSADGKSGTPATPLPSGWIFWRVRVVSGAQAKTSATWQFWVGKASASQNVDTSYGAKLDVNGDGYGDLVVGANGGSGAGAKAGAAHLYFGGSSITSTDWNGSLPPKRIDIVNPGTTIGSFGGAVTDAGDVDGDGFADFLIADTAYTSPGASSSVGAVYLYFGGATASAADWNGANPAKRILIIGADGMLGSFGASLAGVGDINGDGYADFLVGAATTDRSGAAHLFLGSATPTAADWTASASPRRFDFPGIYGGQTYFGLPVAAVGDVNGDGFADFAVAASSANNQAGAVHLYYGDAAPSSTLWNGATPSKRVVITDPSDPLNSQFGTAVAGAFDVNGDGYCDFVIGAPNAANGTANNGKAHVYFGGAILNQSKQIDVLPPNSTTAFVFGTSATSAGDVNGDGFGDFLVGDPQEGPSGTMRYGGAHLYLGLLTPSQSDWVGAAPGNRVDIATPYGAPGSFARNLSGGTDINSDGFADFMIGAPDVDAAGFYFGHATPTAANWNGATASKRLDLSNPDGSGAAYGTGLAE